MKQLSAISHQHAANRPSRQQSRLTADRRTLKATAGFTIIELLTVIVIIAVLAALTLGGAKYARTKARRSSTTGEIHAIEAALEDYKADNGAYPQGSGSAVLYAALLSGNKKYYTKFRPEQLKGGQIYDPFAYEYQYVCPGTHNTVSFDLWSNGPDGTNGTFGAPPVDHDPDNITNWQSH